MQQFVKFGLQALICNRLNPWHEVKEGREVYKIEKCAFSQKHTPLITKIQVYIFVVCCCLILVFVVSFFQCKVRYFSWNKKLNLSKQFIIFVNRQFCPHKFLKINFLKLADFAHNRLFLFIIVWYSIDYVLGDCLLFFRRESGVKKKKFFENYFGKLIF